MKQTGAIFLSIFVFIASINIIVNQHFCNDELESIAFFIKAQPCEHATASEDLPPCHAQKVKDQKKCCSENYVIVESVDWLKVITNNVHLNLTFFSAFHIELEEAILLEENISNYSLQKIPKPPDEFSTIYVEHQAFLL